MATSLKLRLAIVLLAVCLIGASAKAQTSIFDDKAPSSNTDVHPRPPARPRPERPTTQPADPLVEQLTEKVAELQKENADLKARLNALLDAMAATKGVDVTKEKTQQERDKRVADAKAKAESERIAKIVSGITLRRAESLAMSKAKLISSSTVHLEPRAGYFGSLDVRKDSYTLDYTQNGEAHQMSLVVVEGTITEIASQ